MRRSRVERLLVEIHIGVHKRWRRTAVRARELRAPSQQRVHHAAHVLAVVAAVVVFYALPFAGYGTIHWDAVDVHYSSQAFFSEQIRAAQLPFWTPYLFSGFPFPGGSPGGRLVRTELALSGWHHPGQHRVRARLHTLIAVVGTYWLALRLFGHATGALAAGLFYGLSGFFAGHSQHVGMFQTAAWPWLLVAIDALGKRVTAPRLALAGLLGGSIVLAGHFQSALYCASRRRRANPPLRLQLLCRLSRRQSGDLCA
jgi:hypothetical protein